MWLRCGALPRAPLASCIVVHASDAATVLGELAELGVIDDSAGVGILRFSSPFI